eukprot:9085435-Pyramimonas_sp.AAC.1
MLTSFSPKGHLPTRLLTTTNSANLKGGFSSPAIFRRQPSMFFCNYRRLRVWRVVCIGVRVEALICSFVYYPHAADEEAGILLLDPTEGVHEDGPRAAGTRDEEPPRPEVAPRAGAVLLGKRLRRPRPQQGRLLQGSAPCSH